VEDCFTDDIMSDAPDAEACMKFSDYILEECVTPIIVLVLRTKPHTLDFTPPASLYDKSNGNGCLVSLPA
jgi:hypothetical protein